MLKKYACNICREDARDPSILYGVNFCDLHNFTLGNYGSTDGIHICFTCAIQLKKELCSEPITEELNKFIDVCDC